MEECVKTFYSQLFTFAKVTEKVVNFLLGKNLEKNEKRVSISNGLSGSKKLPNIIGSTMRLFMVKIVLKTGKILFFKRGGTLCLPWKSLWGVQSPPAFIRSEADNSVTK